MIQLKSDHLILQTPDGHNIPCSAESMTLELVGDPALLDDPEMLAHAAAAVLHYFKYELNKTFVSMADFSAALESVLLGLGLRSAPPGTAKDRAVEADLRKLAVSAGKGCELFFFPQLREEVKRTLRKSPRMVRFHGLRGCVKQLTGSHRWSRRCDTMNEQIVEFLRGCWETESGGRECAMVVV